MKPSLPCRLPKPSTLLPSPLSRSSRPTLRPRTTPIPNSHHHQPNRTLIAAPKPNSGPILDRHPDRALPDITSATKSWLLTLPLFALAITGSALAIFNYEKSSSSVVSATLYSLRTDGRARELLGDEIYFRDRWPWIWGVLDQVHGRIDIGYGVKGTRAKGYVRFRAERRTRMGFFETTGWELEMEDGRVVGLMVEEGRDPFGREVQEAA